jgi:hypothetical protein
MKHLHYMKIELIKKNTPAFESLIQEIIQLRWWNYPKDSGRRAAANALKDKDVEVLLIREPLINIPIGILSFREEGEYVKIINLGITKKGRGLGELLVEKVREIADGKKTFLLACQDKDADFF